MAKKPTAGKRTSKRAAKPEVKAGRSRSARNEDAAPARRPSSLLDTRVIYCGDCLDQLRNLPDNCIDLIYIDPPFNSNRNNEVFWGETKKKRATSGGEDRHASNIRAQAYIDYMRPRCVELGASRLQRDRARLMT